MTTITPPGGCPQCGSTLYNLQYKLQHLPGCSHTTEPTLGTWQFTRDELDLLDLKPGDWLGPGIVGEPVNDAVDTPPKT